MDKKKITIAIILFIFLGLTVFSFAQTDEPVEKMDGNGNSDSAEVVNTGSGVIDNDASTLATTADDNESSSGSLTINQSTGTTESSSNSDATIDGDNNENVGSNADASQSQTPSSTPSDDTSDETIEDIKAPNVLVNGEKVKEGAVYNGNVVITVEDDTETTTKSIILNGQPIDNVETLVDGVYEITIVDEAGNETTIKFTYDSTVNVEGIEEDTYTYDGKGVTPTSKDVDIKSVTLTKDGVIVEEYELNTAIVNAGTYALTVTDNVGNVATISFEITKATPTIETVEPTLVYNGEKQEYEIIVKDVDGNIIENPSMNVDYYNADTKEKLEGAPVDAGNYTIGIYVRPTDNYTRADKWFNFTVEKATPTIEVVEPTLVYNGEKQEYEVIVKDVNGKVIENPSMNVDYYNADTKEKLEGAPVDAGNYTIGIYVRPTDNYTRADKWFNFTVEKAKITTSLEYPEDMSYTGDAKDIKVKFTDANDNEVTDINYSFVAYRNGTLDLEMKEVGRYQAWVSINTENSNYEFANLSGNSYIEIFYITEAEVVEKTKVTMTVEYPEEGMAYTGNVKELKLVFTDSEGNEITDIKASYSVLNSDFNSYVELKEAGKYLVRINIDEESLNKYDIDYTSWVSVEITAPKDEYRHVLVALDKSYIDYQEIVADGKTEAVYTYKYDGNAKGFVLNLYHNGEDVTNNADILMAYMPEQGGILFNAPSEPGTYKLYPFGMPSEYNSNFYASVVILPAE